MVDPSLSAPFTAEGKALQREIESLRGRIAGRDPESGETDAQLRESIVRFGCEVARLFADQKALDAAGRPAGEREPH